MNQQYSSDGISTRLTTRIVWGLWGFLALMQLGFVLAFCHNQPWNDEWEFVPVLTGNESSDGFFWKQHNEHRMPIPRTIYLETFKITHDYRTGSILQVLILAAISALSIVWSARVRGSLHWTDVFFPAILLHLVTGCRRLYDTSPIITKFGDGQWPRM